MDWTDPVDVEHRSGGESPLGKKGAEGVHDDLRSWVVTAHCGSDDLGGGHGTATMLMMIQFTASGLGAVVSQSAEIGRAWIHSAY